jgi:hypothetical protein
MWPVLYVAGLSWWWLYSLLYTRYHVFVMVSVLYALHYFLYVHNVSDPRPWPWVRGWKLWDYMHHRLLGRVVWAESSMWSDYESKGPRVFLVEATAYDVVAILLTFGLHGQEPKAIKDISPLLVLPDHFFRYPVLANVLQWVGGVPFDRERLERAVGEQVVSLVVVLPHTEEEGDALERADRMDLNLCTWLCGLSANTKQSIRVVPVAYHGADGFYAHPLPFLPLGLCCTCFPRAVHLKVGVARALTLPRDDQDHRDDLVQSPSALLDETRKAQGHFTRLVAQETLLQ